RKVAQLPGVGLVTLSGGQKPAVRIQVNPALLAGYGLTLDDVRNVVAAANVNQAKGSLDGPYQAYTIGANDQLHQSAQYRTLVVAYRNNAPVQLSDVADVIDGAENVRQAAWMNDRPAIVVNIQRQPGANIIEVVDRVKRLLPQLAAGLPASVKVDVLTDRTTTIRASVHDVQFELMLAVALVVLVIFLFLRSAAATFIPGVTVPVSIVGTVASMYALGYCLNTLPLVRDDAGGGHPGLGRRRPHADPDDVRQAPQAARGAQGRALRAGGGARLQRHCDRLHDVAATDARPPARCPRGGRRHAAGHD